jgi:hypothetical protein
MGIWIGVSAMLALNVYRNFDAVETVLNTPPEQAERVFKILEHENARMLLRYTAGVENANTFETWEQIQFALGLLVIVVMFMSTSTRVFSAVPLVMLLLVLFMHFKVGPELAWVGRSLEFTPATANPAAREQFWRLHRIYGILETVKCLLGLGLTVFLVMQSSAKVVRRRHRHEPAAATEFNREAASR